ncbi:MAG: excinuclease ABC subunit UvrA [Chloroflexota bacterium]
MKNIHIQGARVHNLKDINITIPKNQLVVVTGVSGSGKSSLVFDIVFEEGRRQYLQALGMLSGIAGEDRFDCVSGIGPTIAVQQSTIRQSNPRSTVGTKSNILAMLGVLYASDGLISCALCGRPVGEDLACGECRNREERLSASYFSFNSPNGMCLKCSGRGAYFEINMHKLVPDDGETLRQVFKRIEIMPYFYRKFADYVSTPFSQIPEGVKEEILYGHLVNYQRQRRSLSISRILQGRIFSGRDTAGLAAMRVCSDCQGLRIGEEARRVHLNGKNIGELGKMTIADLQDFLEALRAKKELTAFGKNLLDEILRKIRHLIEMRLGHLSLYREMPGLSGGEMQRLFLTSHLDSGMDSLIYILDEPTVGLHESEKAGLLKAIVALKEMGNSVILVEHDRNTIEMAEHIIDIGPRAGAEGGQVIYQGDYPGLLTCKASITGQYLSGNVSATAGIAGRNTVIDPLGPHLTIRSARTNNLKDVTASFPLGALVGVAGVSGSGKSSLVSDTLIPLLKAYFHDPWGNGETDLQDDEVELAVLETVADKLEGMEQLSGYAEVSQAPIGRHQNSNPASYTGTWDKIRRLFARQPEAAQKGYVAGFFSFNSQGACTTCQGSGRESIWLGGDFFVHNTCRQCHGKRYCDEALSIQYKGKNIAEVLEMRVSEAVDFFEGQPGITAILKVMKRIGMGYIQLGQPAPSLSGGEAQRIKLAKEIGKRRKGNILYVLDEPTTGLSLYDTAKLLQLTSELVAKGNSVIVIEHDPVVLSSCDWIIELGPGAGTDGGRVIAQGTPQALKGDPNSITGRYLA